MYVAVLGVVKTGAAYVPIDPAAPADRVEYFASDASLVCLVTVAEKADVARESGVPLVVVDAEVRVELAGGTEEVARREVVQRAGEAALVDDDGTDVAGGLVVDAAQAAPGSRHQHGVSRQVRDRERQFERTLRVKELAQV